MRKVYTSASLGIRTLIFVSRESTGTPQIFTKHYDPFSNPVILRPYFLAEYP